MNSGKNEEIRENLSSDALPELRTELERAEDRKKLNSILKDTVWMLIAAASLVVLLMLFVMPAVKVYGGSMAPTLNEGDILLMVRTRKIAQGDVIGIHYDNKMLIKRCIAVGGQTVDLAEDGTVTVDGIILDEPYVEELSFGNTDISFPFKVPENRFFVMGDRRTTSIDSRNTAVGCVSANDLEGRVFFCVWPPDSFGRVR